MKEILEENDVLLGTDKFGKNIYHNSKIKFGNSFGTIAYSSEHLRFEIIWEDGFSRNITSSFLNLVEVID